LLVQRPRPSAAAAVETSVASLRWGALLQLVLLLPAATLPLGRALLLLPGCLLLQMLSLCWSLVKV
jgi:hypothetical protein